MIVRELVTLLGFKVDDKGLQEYTAKIKAASAAIGDVGNKMSMAFTVPIAAMGVYFVKSASDTTESLNRFQAVFRDTLPQATQWMEQYSSAVGRSKKETMDAASSFMGMAVGLGLGQKQALQMSTQLNELSVDFASFNNMSDSEAQGRFISAMSGSGEVLDRFGINIKESALGLKLQEMGLAKNTQAATETQKALARFAIIKETMGKQGAIGDAIKTAGSFANQLKRVKAVADNLAVEFGQIMLPVLNKLTEALLSATGFLSHMSKETKTWILIIGGVVAAIGPILVIVGAIGAAVTALSGPVIAVAAVIAAIAAVFAFLIDDFLVWQEGGDSALGALFGSFDAFKVKVLAVWEAIKTGFVEGVAYLLELLGPILEGFKTILGGVLKLAGGIWQIIGGLLTLNFKMVWDGIVSLFSGLAQIIGGVFSTVWEIIWAQIKLIGDAFKNLFPFLKMAGGVAGTIGAGMTTAGNALDNVDINRMANQASNSMVPVKQTTNATATFNVTTAPGTTAEQTQQITQEVGKWWSSDVYANNPQGE